MKNANIKKNNDWLDCIYKEVADLKPNLDFMQDQMKDDISDLNKNSKIQTKYQRR